MSNLNEVLQFISQCDESERDQVINALNTQRRVSNNRATSQLHLGARVSFLSRKGRGIIEGTVTKINRKTVKLDCGDQGKWSVSPTFLTLIK
jgi:limonene-1,2-epoxide hydrolase